MTVKGGKAGSLLAKVRKAIDERIDVDQLLLDILQAFGGTVGLAEKLQDTYDVAMDGSPTRAKILSDVMGLIHKRTTDGGEEEVPEEDLQAMLNEVIAERDQPEDEDV